MFRRLIRYFSYVGLPFRCEPGARAYLSRARVRKRCWAALEAKDSVRGGFRSGSFQLHAPRLALARRRRAGGVNRRPPYFACLLTRVGAFFIACHNDCRYRGGALAQLLCSPKGIEYP